MSWLPSGVTSIYSLCIRPQTSSRDDEMKRPECFDDMNVVKHPCKGMENIGGPHHDEYGQCIHHWDCRTARIKAWQERSGKSHGEEVDG